jgi:hypothetical protein
LSRLANAEPHPSFLPKVLARLEQAPAVRRDAKSWFLAGSVVALAAGVCLTFAVFERVPSRPEREPARVSVTSEATKIADPREGLSQQPPLSVTRWQPRIHRTARAAGGAPKAPWPEVIVPPDERIAFAKFVSGLSQPNGVAIAVVETVPVVSSAFPSEPLEIAELKIEPLAPNEAE